MILSPTFYIFFIIVATLLVFAVYRNKRLLPGPTPIPGIGNVFQLNLKQLHRQLENWVETYGELYEFWIFGQRHVVIGNKQIGKQLLWARPDAFTRPPHLRNQIRALGADGLFSAEGDFWKRHRKLLSPAFSKAAAARMSHCVTIPIERMLKKWQTRIQESPDGSVIMPDPRMEMSCLTLDVITYLACGFDVNSVESSDAKLARQLQEYFNTAADRVLPSFKTSVIEPIFGLQLNKSFIEARQAVRSLVEKMIETTRQEVMAEQASGTTSEKSNLLKEMILTSLSEDDFLNDEELTQEVIMVMLAGLDTTSILLGWAIYFLAKYPNYQNKLREEVTSVTGENTIPTIEHLSKLKFTTYFLQETLRLRGPAPHNIVCNIEPIEVSGITFPAGTHFWVMQRHIASQGLSDPQAFHPERWEEGAAPGGEISGFQSALPFGGGPRICPGRPLAMLEATIALAALVRAFNFELAGEEPDELLNFVMIPTPYKVKVRSNYSL